MQITNDISSVVIKFRNECAADDVWNYISVTLHL